MNKLIKCLFLLSLLLFLTACSSSFKQTIKNSNTINTHTTVQHEAIVAVGSDEMNTTDKHHIVGLTLQIASDAASQGISATQQQRLQRLINSEKIAELSLQSFTTNIQALTHLTAVPNNTPYDLKILIIIESFGISARTPASPFDFFINAKIEIIKQSTTELVYTRPIILTRSLTEIDDNTSTISTAVSAAVNLSAFFQLSDAEIIQTFNILASELGKLSAMQIYEDSK